MAEKNLDNATWRKRAAEYQAEHAKYVGNKRDVSTVKILKDRIAFAIFGLPDDVKDVTKIYENYSQDQQKIVNSLTKCICENQDKDAVFVSLILISGRLNDGRCFQQYVFRVPGDKFIDYNCRIYKNWNDFEENNKLPEAQICYPKMGKYTFTGEKLLLEYRQTPEASEKTKLMKMADVGSSVAAVGASVVVGASLFIPVAGPLIWASFATATATGVYFIGRNSSVLDDRRCHGQTISLVDPEARDAWLCIIASISSLAATGAAVATRIAQNNGFVTQKSITAIHIANGVYVISSALQLANNTANLLQKKEISKMDVFQFMCSLLMLCNASVSAYQSYVILHTLSVTNQNGLEYVSALSKNARNLAFSENTSALLPNLPLVKAFFSLGPLILNGKALYDYTVENFKDILNCIKKLFNKLLKHVQNMWEEFEKEIGECLEKIRIHLPPHMQTQTKSMSACFNFSEKLKIKHTLDRYPGSENKIASAVSNKAGVEGFKDNQEFKEFIVYIIDSIEAKVAAKESDFQKKYQNGLKSGLTEQQLEEIYGIQGDRFQHFFEESMRELPDDSDKFWKLSLEEFKENKDGKVDMQPVVSVAKEAEGTVVVKTFSDLPVPNESDWQSHMNLSKVLRCRLMQLLKTNVGDFEIATERMSNTEDSITFIVQFKSHNNYQTAFVKATHDHKTLSGIMGLTARCSNLHQ